MNTAKICKRKIAGSPRALLLIFVLCLEIAFYLGNDHLHVLLEVARSLDFEASGVLVSSASKNLASSEQSISPLPLNDPLM